MSPIQISNSTLPNPLPFYYRAVANGKSFKDGDSFPDISCQWLNFKFPQSVLKRYKKVCCIEAEGVPLLFPHSFLGPLHLQMMTHKDFPLKLLGSLHHRNHVIQYQPLEIEQAYDVFLKLGALRYGPQGLDFDLHTDIKTGDKTLWSSVASFLVRKKHGREPMESPLGALVTNIAGESQERLAFQVPASVGKSFGLITKDINPIHMSSLLAKLFGFKRDLAHGMWALGRGCEPLIRSLIWQEPIRMDVAFKGPVYMKDRVRLMESQDQEGHFEFYSGTNERPSIVGTVKNVAASEHLTQAAFN